MFTEQRNNNNYLDIVQRKISTTMIFVSNNTSGIFQNLILHFKNDFCVVKVNKNNSF